MTFLSSLLGRLKPWGYQILTGLLGVSLLANLGLGLYARHQSGLYQKCRESVVVTTAVAKEAKVQTEKRNETIVRNTQDRVTTRIANTLDRLRNQTRGSNLSVSSGGTVSVDSPGPAPELLPELDPLTQEKDREVCVTNTILLEEWQRFYEEIKTSMIPVPQPSPVSPSPTP